MLYSELFEETWKAGYTDLIQVTLNSKGSGTYQAAILSRNLFYGETPGSQGTACHPHHRFQNLQHAVFKDKLNGGKSIADWMFDAVNGNVKTYGLDLLDKKY